MAIGYSRNRLRQAPLAKWHAAGYAPVMLDFVLSLMVLAALVLLAGAVFLWRRGDGRRALLMGALALVIAGNVAIWLVPTDSGDTLAESAAAG